MTLEHVNPTIVIAILLPAIICIGAMLLYMLKYWREKRKEEKNPIPVYLTKPKHQSFTKEDIEPYHPEDQPGNDELPDAEEEFEEAMREEFGDE